MNRFPLNASVLNGARYVGGLAEAEVAVLAELSLSYGNSAAADFVVALEAEAEAFRLVSLEAHALLQMEADGEAYVARHAEGDADIELAAEGEAYLAVGPDGQFDIVFLAEGDGTAGKIIEGESDALIELYGEAEGKAHPTPWGNADFIVHLTAEADACVFHGREIIGNAEIPIVGLGYGNLVATIGGEASIALAGGLEARLGAKIPLSGEATMRFLASARPLKWRQVHGEGEAVIGIEFTVERHGRPEIPSIYVPAHPAWRLTVPSDEWMFIVPRDEWGQQ